MMTNRVCVFGARRGSYRLVRQWAQDNGCPREIVDVDDTGEVTIDWLLERGLAEIEPSGAIILQLFRQPPPKRKTARPE